jgi:uncharacterized protein (DUF1501 family)
MGVPLCHMDLLHRQNGVSRRAAIRAGTLGFMGLGMSDVARLRAEAPAARGKSVIYVFLSGGLAQHESFDLKPNAPREIRGEFNPIRTKTPGIHICEHLPMLAQRSDKWALVRSLTHPHNEHSQGHHAMLTGMSTPPAGFNSSKPQDTDDPSIAAITNSILKPRGHAPTPVIVMPDKIVHRTGRTIPGQFAGRMGPARDPWFLEASPKHPLHYGAYPKYLFHHATGAMKDPALTFQSPQLTLPQGLNLRRVTDRIALRQNLETQSRALETAANQEDFDKYRQAALSLLTNGKAHDAFDLSKADPKQIERYGDNSFGWSLLMARNLVNLGVNLVQVNLGNNETWDTHQAAFPNLKDYLLPPMDRALSALIDDLHASGLLDDTLVVMASEFGRTPKISTLPSAKLPGRDHWGAVQSILCTGGGVHGGNVIGASDKIGGHPARAPQKPENLAATIYETLGIPTNATYTDSTGRPHSIYHAKPIKGLM